MFCWIFLQIMSADSDSVCSAAVDGSILIDDKDSDQSHGKL